MALQEAVYHVLDYAPNTYVMQQQGQITSVTTIGERLKQARMEAGLTQAALAKKAGVSQGTIGNFEAGRGEAPREILKIAEAANVRAEWLKSGQLPKRATPLAHGLIHDGRTVPPLLRWEGALIEQLQEGTAFRLAIPDNAMSPRVTLGMEVVFIRAYAPVIGKGVLLIDPKGGLHLRNCHQSLTDAWEGVPENSAFLTLKPVRDGVRVVAVTSHIMQPW